MIIKFKKVTIHNFLSFGHSEIDLDNCGYCTVSGINQCVGDGAKSNGSGKSSLFSSLTFALTGSTTQGVTSNLKNIFVDENLCYVKLEFNVDGVEYIVTRYKEPKPDLKILVNGEDKSGKGIREGDEMLKKLLPDLDLNLLLSVVILGQGLPHKLTSYTPSGRKDILETLSKSDYMIEDIKLRIEGRKSTLGDTLNGYELKKVGLDTKRGMVEETVNKLTNFIDNYNEVDYDVLIGEKEGLLQSITDKIESSSKDRDELSIKLKNTNDGIVALSNARQEEVGNIRTSMTKELKELDDIIRAKTGDLNVLKKKLEELNSISDVCPTCGQKIPGVFKPDTTELERNVNSLNDELTGICKDYRDKEESFNLKLHEIGANYDTQISKAKGEYDQIYTNLTNITNTLNVLNREALSTKAELDVLRTNKNSSTKTLEDKKKELEDNKMALNDLNKDLAHLEELMTDVKSHIAVINQMNTLIKRDFRGYLLSNVIKYIDTKCKEFGSYLFGTNDLNFYLDGNNIDIMFCGRLYESLSGGEKQKVDVVLQFAIREMMSSFMNFSSNIIVLDEIFDNLDGYGTNGVINLISNKLCDVESIFIISHHSDELQIPNDTELKVVKNNEGISEVL